MGKAARHTADELELQLMLARSRVAVEEAAQALESARNTLEVARFLTEQVKAKMVEPPISLASKRRGEGSQD